MMAMIPVKFIKKHHEYGYFAGMLGVVEAHRAPELLQKGYIIILPDGSAEANVDLNMLPADLPGRELLFEEGFKDLASIKEAGESLKLIKGIKQKMYSMIMGYIEDKEK